MTEQNKIGYGVVLLLPQEIIDIALALNVKLGSERKIFLDNINVFPHITLAQGITTSESLHKIEHILQNLVLEFSGLELEATSIYNRSKVTEISCKKSPQLLGLHHKVIENLAPFTSYDPKQEYFYDGRAVDGFLEYISHFFDHSGEHYEPHITIGFGKLDEKQDNLPVIFKPAKLALCHLGDYGTCRKILVAYPL